jgi:hypothetical protein
VLTKQQSADGGMTVETGLAGPAVFLDVWAVRELSRTSQAALSARFVAALRSARGSLLVSSALVTELETLKGDSRARAQALFSAIGSQWLLINPIISVASAREARDEVGAYLSNTALNGYVIERSGELLRAGADPHSPSDAEFFDLGRTLDWTAEDPAAASTAAAQSKALKDTAKARADADREEQRRDRNAHQRLYPPIPFTAARMLCTHNAVWREVTRVSLGRTWMPNDGFDVTHLVPAMCIGGLIAVDTDWKDIGEVAAAELPGGHVDLYRPGELERLVLALETSNR